MYTYNIIVVYTRICIGGLVRLSGPVASIARRAVYAIRMPTNKQKVNAVVNAGITTATSVLKGLLAKRS